MAADRPSRELRMVTSDSGSVRLEEVTDPPPAPPRLPRPTVAPGRLQSWVLVLVAILGAGGAPALVQALRGDGGASLVAAEVRELRGAVARLEDQARVTTERVTELRATVEAREQARREERAIVGSYLRQTPPDPRGALDAMGAER